MARVWPWQLASAVASGVSALIQRQYRQSRRASRPETSYHVVYPVNNSELPPYERKRRSVPSDWECPGCRRSHPGDSLSHTRKQGQCKWVHVPPKYWDCSACRQNKSSDHPDHLRIDGKCRHGPTRLPRLDGGRARGSYPTDARTPTREEPNAGLRIGDEVQDAATGLSSLHGAPGTIVRPDIAQQEADAEAEMIEEPGRSSADQDMIGQEIPQDDDEVDPAQAEESEEEIGPEDALVSQSRRKRRRRAGSAQAGQEFSWTGFDLKKSIQLLGPHDERVLRRIIRVLHI